MEINGSFHNPKWIILWWNLLNCLNEAKHFLQAFSIYTNKCEKERKMLSISRPHFSILEVSNHSSNKKKSYRTPDFFIAMYKHICLKSCYDLMMFINEKTHVILFYRLKKITNQALVQYVPWCDEQLLGWQMTVGWVAGWKYWHVVLMHEQR